MARIELETAFVSLFLTFVFVGVLLWAFGLPLATDQYALMLAVLIGLLLMTQLSKDFDVGFALMTLAILFVLIDFFLPQRIVDPIAGVFDQFASVLGADISPFGALDSVDYLVVTTLFVFLYLAAKYRISGTKKFGKPLIDKVLSDFSDYWQLYVSTARLVFLFFFIALVVVLEQSALALGELGQQAGEVPFIVSNLVLGAAGFFSLGGEFGPIVTLPLIGDLGPWDFVALVIVMLGIGAAIRYEASGPLAQFLRR